MAVDYKKETCLLNSNVHQYICIYKNQNLAKFDLKQNLALLKHCLLCLLVVI